MSIDEVAAEQREKGWRYEILPGYWELKRELRESYDRSPTTREEFLRDECRGGVNFARTFALAMNKTRDAVASMSIYNALMAMVDHPFAGTTAWDMRKFIRYAPPEMVEEFGQLIKRLVDAKGEKFGGFDTEDFWFYYSNASIEERKIGARAELDKLKSLIGVYL